MKPSLKLWLQLAALVVAGALLLALGLCGLRDVAQVGTPPVPPTRHLNFAALGTAAAPSATLAMMPTSTPVPTPVPATVPPTLAVPLDLPSSDQSLICSYPWPCDDAMRIFRGPTRNCPNGESTGNWGSHSRGNYGGFQIHCASHVDKIERVTGTRSCEQLYVPEVNVAVAYIIWADQGWGPWDCWP